MSEPRAWRPDFRSETLWSHKKKKHLLQSGFFIVLCCRYGGPLLEETVMTKALDEGAKSVEITKVVQWATKELSGFYGIEDHVNAISGNLTFSAAANILLQN